MQNCFKFKQLDRSMMVYMNSKNDIDKAKKEY